MYKRQVSVRASEIGSKSSSVGTNAENNSDDEETKQKEFANAINLKKKEQAAAKSQDSWDSDEDQW